MRYSKGKRKKNKHASSISYNKLPCCLFYPMLLQPRSVHTPAAAAPMHASSINSLLVNKTGPKNILFYIYLFIFPFKMIMFRKKPPTKPTYTPAHSHTPHNPHA